MAGARSSRAGAERAALLVSICSALGFPGQKRRIEDVLTFRLDGSERVSERNLFNSPVKSRDIHGTEALRPDLRRQYVVMQGHLQALQLQVACHQLIALEHIIDSSRRIVH